MMGGGGNPPQLVSAKLLTAVVISMRGSLGDNKGDRRSGVDSVAEPNMAAAAGVTPVFFLPYVRFGGTPGGPLMIGGVGGSLGITH
jgi:hypothetical protein